MNISEVVVIGAGPAGLVSCFWLQKFGIPHILMDKDVFPREKACADNLTSNAIRMINEINDQYIPDMLSRKLLNPIYGIDLSVKSKNALRLNFKWLDDQRKPSCYAIKRSHLDKYLMDEVAKNPLTTVIQDCFVTSIDRTTELCSIKTKDGRIFHTKLAIVTTGSNFNPIEKQKELKKEYIHYAVGISTYFKGIKHESNYCSWFLKKTLVPGGLYISPLPDGYYNVNVVVRSDLIKKSDLNLRKEFIRLIENDPILKEKFKDATRVDDFYGSKLTLGTKKRSICGDRYMLAGDSAGLIDLITANGIPQAMLSGKLAAEQAKKCLEKNDFSKEFIKNYEDTLFNSIAKTLKLGRMVNPLLSYSLINKLAIAWLGILTKNGSQNSSLAKLSYHKRPTLLLINPLFYFKLFKETLSKEK
jgi:flavin-dependent dehydrogenase